MTKLLDFTPPIKCSYREAEAVWDLIVRVDFANLQICNLHGLSFTEFANKPTPRRAQTRIESRPRPALMNETTHM